jgi:hypothetical protein
MTRAAWKAPLGIGAALAALALTSSADGADPSPAPSGHIAHAAATDESQAGDEPPPPSAPAGDEGRGGSSLYAHWWIGVAGAIDFLVLPGGENLCVLTAVATPASAAGYYCTNPNGTDFPSRVTPAQNDALIPGQAGTLNGGLAAGDVRPMAAIDYALSPAWLIGARVGYVLNAYPSAGAAVTAHHAFGSRIHAEARGTYVFGDSPLSHEGFAPTLFLSAGVAEFDGHLATYASWIQSPQKVAITEPVNAWVTSGPWFVAAGGGARYQFSQRAAFNAALRVNAAFSQGGVLFTFGPEIALQYGF